MERNSRRVIQTAKLFIKFVEQLNRSNAPSIIVDCQERKRANNKVDKKAPDTDLILKSDPRKKVKLEKPKQNPQPPPVKNNMLQQPPSFKTEDHKQQPPKKTTAGLYSFKDQKPIDLKPPHIDDKDMIPMNSYSNMASAYSFFGHPPNSMFPEGMQFFPSPVDPVTYFNFHQNKQFFPGYYIQPGLTPDKLQYFGLAPMIPQKNFMMQQMPHVEPSKPLPKLQVSKQRKLFKRASYHVAIAYNIHLQKLNKKSPGGNVDPNQLDPTYKARSLKEQKGGQRRENMETNKQTENTMLEAEKQNNHPALVDSVPPSISQTIPAASIATAPLAPAQPASISEVIVTDPTATQTHAQQNK